MYRLIGVILLLSFSLISCTGKIREGQCPNGEPIFITKDLQEAFPAYTKENEAGLSIVDNVLSNAQASATLKTKVVKLRQDLDQERIELETRHKSVLMALRTMPCDKTARESAWKLLGDIKTKTTQIPDRVKQLTEDAAVKLESEVSNLLHYPDATKDTVTPQTTIEAMLTEKRPRRLFDLLVQYNDKVVLSVPKVGIALRDHKVAYYEFQKDVKQLEDSMMERIGGKAKTQFRKGWKIYLMYVISRYGGNSQSQIMAQGNYLNYDITWDDCERTYQEFLHDKPLSQTISQMFHRNNAMGANVAKLATGV
jgi:hypothetical protein